MKKNKFYYFISFFTFIGYYAGLTLVIALGYIDLSRYYSLPLRLLLSAVMIYLMVNLRFRYTQSNQFNFKLFWVFWFIYLLAILKAIAFQTVTLRMSAVEYLGYLFLYNIIPFLFFSLEHNIKTFKIFKNAIITSGVFLAIVSYIFYGSLLSHGVGRISMAKYMNIGFTDVMSPLALSYASSLVITICLYYILYIKLNNKTRYYYWVAILLSLVPFLLGASRGSVFAMVLALVLIIFFHKSAKHKLKVLLLIIIFGFVVGYTAAKTESAVFTRVFNISEDVKIGDQSAIRLLMWESAWEQFLKSPIIGDSIQSVIPPHPHNIILEVLMSTGLIGFIPFISLLLITLKKGIKIIKYRPEHVWVFILFFQGLIQNMFSGAVYAAIFYWAGMGLVFSVNIQNNSRKILN